MTLTLAQRAANAMYALRGRPPKYASETAQVGHPDIYGGIITTLDKVYATLENPDALVGKKGYKIYDEMVDRDPTIKAGMSYRMAIMLSPEHRVKPVNEDEGQDRYWSDFVAWNYEHMESSIDRVHWHMGFRSQTTGIYIGELVFAPIEKGPYAGMVGLKTIKQRYADSFEFRPDEYGNLRGPKAFSQLRSDGERRYLDPEKFVIYPFEFRDSNWWGNSRLRPIYKYYHLGDYAERYAAVYTEKHSGPTIGAKYPPGTPEGERNQLLEVLKKLKNMGIWMAPSDWEVLLSSPSPVHTEFFEWITSYCNKMKVRGMMVPELLQSEGEGHGSYKLGKVQIEIPFIIGLGYDSRDLEQIFHRQVTMRLIDINQREGQVIERYPRFQRDAIKGAPDESSLKLMEDIANGIWPLDKTTAAWFARLFGMPDPPKPNPKAAEPEPGNGEPPAPPSGEEEMAEHIRATVFAQMEEAFQNKGRFAHGHAPLASDLASFVAAKRPEMPVKERKRLAQAEASAWVELLKFDVDESGADAFGGFPIERMLHSFGRRVKEDG